MICGHVLIGSVLFEEVIFSCFCIPIKIYKAGRLSGVLVLCATVSKIAIIMITNVMRYVFKFDVSCIVTVGL